MELNLISGKIQEILENIIRTAILTGKWKALFSKSGEAIVQSPETEKELAIDLGLVFSKDNMHSLAKEMEHEPGILFEQKLTRRLQILFKKYEIEEKTADTYIRFFLEKVKEYLAENDPIKHLEMMTVEGQENEIKRLELIEQKVDIGNEQIRGLINGRNDGIYSLEEIENEIKKYAKYNMDLSFFDWDDEAFEHKLGKAISKNDRMIFIEGKSREETLYRVINLLKQHYSQKRVYIVKSEDGWKKIESNHPKNYVLIAYFRASAISAVMDNINIFIYSEDEACDRKEKIILKRRTIDNLEKSLIDIGFESRQANMLLQKTHGIYAVLKKHLFYTEAMQKPSWTDQDQDVILAALLCGKWTGNEGDLEFIRILSGKDDDQFRLVLSKYDKGENPFFIRTGDSNETGATNQIASIEEAWTRLRHQITPELWNLFLDNAKVILSTLPCNYDSLIKKIEAIKSGKILEGYSQILRKGIIRTFILWTCIDAKEQDQKTIDNAVSSILDTINTGEAWKYISAFFPELCEAAPGIILKKLENEIQHPTGMQELFFEGTDYISILWAIEQLLQQKRFVTRAIEWLWETDSKNYKYNNSNSPRDILRAVFCAWCNLTPMSKDQKIKEAEKALQHYENAWDIIIECLPDMNNSLCDSFNKPVFKNVDSFEDVYQNDLMDVYHAYLEMCVKGANNHADRYIKLLEKLTFYDSESQEKTIKKIIESAEELPDEKRCLIKSRLRMIVHKHRYFANSNWAMDEKTVSLYEDAIQQIVLTNKIYDYLYLFQPEHSFPLLHPVPYHQNGEEQEDVINSRMMEEERENKIAEFKELRYSVNSLIEILMKDNDSSEIGYVLARYYDHESFNPIVFESLIHNCINGHLAVCAYVCSTIKNDSEKLKNIIHIAKEQGADNILVADLISLQIIDDTENAMIFSEHEDIKKTYWSNPRSFCCTQASGHEVVLRAIDECYTYGNLKSYIELLYRCRKELNQDTYFQSFLRVLSISDTDMDSMTEWYFENVLEDQQQRYIEDKEKSVKIAQIEWWAANLIKWEKMKCAQKLVKKDPRVYAALVAIVCRKEEETPCEEGKREKAAKLYPIYRDMHFCPAEHNGNVKYDELIEWVNDFRSILEGQYQGFLWDLIVGELLPYSPVDEDGFMPCKAVREFIEKYHTENMSRAYVNEIYNMRGVYIVDGGKSEEALARKFEENANALVEEYPYTAELYYELSSEYRSQANAERERAENGWF